MGKGLQPLVYSPVGRVDLRVDRRASLGQGEGDPGIAGFGAEFSAAGCGDDDELASSGFIDGGGCVAAKG